MTLVFGGAYQGKLDYVFEHYHLTPQDTCDCSNGEPDYSKIILYRYDEFILTQIKTGNDPIDYINNHLDELKEKIIIINDLSCGVVPIDPIMRQWREAVGRCSALLSRKSESVIRVFCGIGTVLKV